MDPRESLNGILIHKLPKEYKTEALAHFSNQSFTCGKHDEKGLQIFFNKYHLARESIIKKTMLVRRTQYSIYSLVTNLTLHGIRPYAKKYNIKTLAKTFGSVIDLYEIQEKFNHNDKRLLITNDYRIILDIPEVLANLDLAPLTLPGLDIEFPITFFCRLCRQNGHKQHQCSNVLGQDMENSLKSASRQMSYDAPPNRREALISQNAVQDNAGTLHKRIPEVLPEILKVREGKVIERDLTSTKIEKKWVRKHEKSEYHHKASLNRHVEALSNSSPKRSESVNNHNHPREVKQTTLMLPKGNESKTVFKSPGGGKSDSDSQHFKTVHQKGSRDASTKECNSVITDPLTGARLTQSRKRIGPVLSRILPPGIEVRDIQKIISDMNTFGYRNLPPDVEETLEYVLSWNKKKHPRQNLAEQEPKLLKLIQRLLDKARRAKTERSFAESCSNDPKMRRHQEQRSSIGERKGIQTASPTTSKTRRRRTSISPGITQAINRTKGILKPSSLFNFLMQVRGRKNISAVVSHFTTDLSALVTQLQQVVGIYCRGSVRGTSEDRDIRWIESLCSRLKGNSESSAQHFDTQNASNVQSRRTSLSPVIAKAISEVSGALKPELLTNFLVQVRGRRKLLEVAKYFTTDRGALVAQLQQVIGAYYCSDQKDAAGEQDVRRIKGVCQRLLNGEGASAQELASKFTNVHHSRSQVAIKTEPIPSRVFPPNPHIPDAFTKPEPTVHRMFIKTEPTEE